ncbi:MAG: hypothetical protein K9L74_00265 [Candidatus Izimaplasma sp.]|nr:hypothetical protein [Candidatus Izimaplasma bacterium]
MDKKKKTNLPTTISDANRDISTTLQSDLEKESKLLKKLVDEVLEANMEVKKKNEARIEETQNRISDLENKIDSINMKIDNIDRETVLKQLNDMIHTENQIFEDRNEMRFHRIDSLESRLEDMDTLFEQLLDIMKTTKDEESNYAQLLNDNNSDLFDTQLSVSKKLIAHVESVFKEKETFIINAASKIDAYRDDLTTLENELFQSQRSLINNNKSYLDTSMTGFSKEDMSKQDKEAMIKQHKETINNYNHKLDTLESKYQKDRKALINEFKTFKTTLKNKIESEFKGDLTKEQRVTKEKEETLKEIRQQIISAEKLNNFEKVQSLLKEFDRIEKSKPKDANSSVSRSIERDLNKKKSEIETKLSALQVNYITEKNDLKMNIELENINFEESKILFKIKKDRDNLKHDVKINKKRFKEIETHLLTREKACKKLFKLRYDLRKKEYEFIKESELDDITLLKEFEKLIIQLKKSEHDRIIKLSEYISDYELENKNRQFKLDRITSKLQLNKRLKDIDHTILLLSNNSKVNYKKKKEENNSEIIYQESLIDIAKKERKLQILKVKSLYENERNLAEEQVERINLGIKVNQKFVKTTMENQLLFANQQIECAKNEYNIRLESILLTKEQEIEGARRKIDYYRQDYDYEISQLQKELDSKLEDLEYKKLLFTDKSENEKIKKRIQKLENYYASQIQEIEKKKNNDDGIRRYQKVVKEAENRAQKAIDEAKQIRDETVASFEKLRDQTKHKIDSHEATGAMTSSDDVTPLIGDSAISSADERLQQATKEADELFEERTKIPKKRIKELKQELDELETNMSNNQEIETLNQEKETLIKSHKQDIKQLEKQHKSDIKDIESNKHRAQLIKEKELEQLRNNLKDVVDFNDSLTIEADYDALLATSKQTYQNHLEDTETFVKKTLKNHKSLYKKQQKLIKKTLKSYNKYIKYDSKDTRKQKRAIKRKYKKSLKKKLKVLEAINLD